MSDTGMIIIITIQFVLLILLLYCIYLVANKGQASSFVKWVMFISSVGILALADKIKLLVWLIAVGVIWVIKYYKKHKQNEFT